MATQPTQQLISDLRTLLRDNPDFNRVIDNQDGRELQDAELALALRLALSDYNATPPRTNSSFKIVPEYIILMGGVVMAAQILGFGHTRNEFNYTSGGVTVRIFDKTPHYMNWINRVSSNYENAKLNFKIANNINASLGQSVPSEYASISVILI